MQLTPAEVLHAAVAAGWSTTQQYTPLGYLSPAEVISAISYAESRNNTNSVDVGGGSDTEVSLGLVQANAVGGIAAKSQYSIAQLTDPVNNLKLALSNWSPKTAASEGLLESFQGPWAAELGVSGEPIGSTAHGGGGNFAAFQAGLVPYLTSDVSYQGSYPEGEAPSYTGGGKTWTFAELESLIAQRGGSLAGGTATSPGTGGTAPATVTTSPANGQVPYSPPSAPSTSGSGSGGETATSFVGSLMRDLEVAALAAGATLGLYASLSHMLTGGVVLPGVGQVQGGGNVPEVWWVLGCSSGMVLWSIFSKQDPLCVARNLLATKPGTCAGTLKGGNVVVTLLALFGASKLLSGLPQLIGSLGGKGSEGKGGSTEEPGEGGTEEPGEGGTEGGAGGTAPPEEPDEGGIDMGDL